MTSSVTLWAIHAGHSDWMPDWIIRNSAGADLKRKSGKVQHWEHTTQARSAGFSWSLLAPQPPLSSGLNPGPAFLELALDAGH